MIKGTIERVDVKYDKEHELFKTELEIHTDEGNILTTYKNFCSRTIQRLAMAFCFFDLEQLAKNYALFVTFEETSGLPVAIN